MLNHLIEVTKELLTSRYPKSSVIFLAGSLVRGEGTPFSDLDLAVIFEDLPAAYRDSYYFSGFPVEAFVHTPETLNYFLHEVDRPSGVPSLARMIVEGVETPQANQLSRCLKEMAASLLALGPPALDEATIDKWRYNITNLIEDIRQPRSQTELIATGAELYEKLADYYFRVNNIWSARGKSIPRTLKQTDEDLCQLYCDAFAELFAHGQTEKAIALTEAILQPKGGFHFEGYRLEASPECRKSLV